MENYTRFIHTIITSEATPEGLAWLEEKREILQKDFKQSSFFMTFSAVPRFFSHQILSLSSAQVEEANQLRQGFSPQCWTLSQAVRIFLLLQIPYEKEDLFTHTLQQLWDTADMNEATALYAALPVLPFPEALLLQAIEGVRTNITPIFDAIALHNPYPANYFPESAWNQLYLKAAFMNRPIHLIQGIRERANADLAHIVSDFAHERWAAGRSVPPDMWMTVSQFVAPRILEDLKKLLQDTDPIQQLAALLVCQESESNDAKDLLNQFTDWKKHIQNREVSWKGITETWYQNT